MLANQETGYAAARPAQERSVGELFEELAIETTSLVRQEIKLATTEVTQKAVYAGRQAVFVAAGAVFGLVSLLCLSAALVLGLASIMSLWLSALLVGLVVGTVAWAVIVKGVKALKGMDPELKQTIRSFRETRLWAKRQVR